MSRLILDVFKGDIEVNHLVKQDILRLSLGELIVS